MAARQLALPVLLLAAPVEAVTLHTDKKGCSCMSWKEAYGTHRVKCGSGYELSNFGVQMLPAAQTFMPAGLYDEFCTRFYQRISFNSCFNLKFGTLNEQWCYTSADCNEAQKVGATGVAVKNCSASDDFMRTKAPEELNRLAAANDLEIGLFGKLSYAMDAMKWSDVEAASDLPASLMAKAHTMESFYGLKWAGAKPATEAAKQKVKETAASGVTTIFDADNGHGGGTLIAKSKIYGFLPLEGRQALGYVCMSDHGKPCQ